MNIPTRSVAPLTAGIALARFAKALRLGAEFAQREWPDAPHVAHALTLRMKEDAGAMSMSGTPDLVAVGIWDQTTTVLLQGVDAFEAARPRMREIPFNVAAPRELSTGTVGGWVDETTAKPVLSFAFDNVLLPPAVVGGIVVLSDTLIKDRRTEPLIRDRLLATLGRTSTRFFLDPTATATAAHPGSITSTGTAITTTANVAGDLASMLAAITTSGAGLTWILSPLDLAFIAANVNAPDVPRTLLGLPVILAPQAPSHQVTLADLSEVVYAALPLAIDLSRASSLEMDDAPTQTAGAAGSPAGPVGTVVVSMFQTNSGRSGSADS
jgi:HK97 family phage major capsid protein